MKFPVLRWSCCALASLIGGLGSSGSASAQIAPGNLVVVRVGDGLTSLNGTSIVVFLDEYTTGGALVQTIALPTAASTALTLAGNGTSEGFLNQSIDGQYLVLGGYRAVPGVANIATTTSAARPRVVGRVALDETIDTTTALTDAYSGSFIGSATSNDGTQFWTGGNSASSGSVRYAASLGATTSTQLSTTPTNTRVVFVHDGQLYVSASTGAFRGVSRVGTGLPTTSGQTITLLPGFPTTSGPQSFDYFFADDNTLYVADDRTSTSGGIQKWTFNAGAWTLQYTLNPASGVGARGLTGSVDGGVTTLYATTGPVADNRIVSVIDTGPASTFLTVAKCDDKSGFRGIRLVRTPCSPPSITSQPQDSSVCVGASASFTVAATGTPTLVYQWRKDTVDLSDGGNISGANTPTLTIDPTTAGDSGNYDVVVSNGCGSVTSASRTLAVDSTDTDGDGTADCNDGCPDDPAKTAPGICGCGVADTDTDGDGTADCNDGCPDDPAKTAPGICGCGVADTDTDGDGTADCNDGCPDDPAKTAPGQCGCGIADTDTDSDGTADCNDGCPEDPNKIAPGVCGCGFADLDDDLDGIVDCVDNCPGLHNPAQEDADGDGKGDLCDNCDNDVNPGQEDCDNDGVGDACEGEPDCNLNGVPDSCDISSGTSQDLNGDGVPDECVVDVIPFCFGDGSGSGPQCPCGNNGAPGNGCANSTHPGGANLSSTGIPSLSNDTLRLHVTDQHPSSLSLFVQGTLEVGPFLYGDGLRCVGGQLKRLFIVKNAHAENVSAPTALSIPPLPATVSSQSAALGDPLFVGAVRGYMVFYRDPDPNFCPPGTFNVTNALRVVWAP